MYSQSRIVRTFVAGALTVSVLTLQSLPYVALAEDASDATAASSTETSASSATSTESTTSDTSSVAGTATSSTASSSTTTVDNLEIHATSSEPIFSDGFLTGSSEVVTGSTTDAGFASTTNFGNQIIATSSGDLNVSTTTFASSTPSITTGRALALANILNILNSTFLNSDGSILFANYTDEAGSIDLRDQSVFAGFCGTLCAGLTGVEINLLQDAFIRNQIILSANSGQNQISNASTTGSAILTGEAFAGLNLVNLANVSFVDSNYLLVLLNAFRGVKGDIVFPSLLQFLSGDRPAVSAIDLNQNGTVDNAVSAQADSGSNVMDVRGDGAIQTGNANSYVNVFNQINSLLAGSGIAIMLRFSGEWNGDIFGLPDSMTVVRGPNSLLITGGGAGTSSGNGPVGVSGTTTADIANDVRVEALSGENGITDSTSTTALISTGNAFAAANVINIANQTVIGRNWLLAVLNIFGDFNGNIAFGRPDLWVGAQAQAPATLRPGNEVTYQVTIKNRGDAISHANTLSVTYDPSLVEITPSDAFEDSGSGTLTFNLGTMQPQDTRQVTFAAHVRDVPDGTDIASVFTVRGQETDNDLADNTDRAIVRTGAPAVSGGGAVFIPAPAFNPAPPQQQAPQPRDAQRATIEIERNTQASSARIGDAIPQSVVVRNTGSTAAQSVFLRDTLRSPSGAVVHTEDWDIGAIAPNEEVVLQYDLSFDVEATPGLYSLSAHVEGSNSDSRDGAIGTIELQGDVGTLVSSSETSAFDIQEPLHAAAPIPTIRTARSDVERSPISATTSVAEELPRETLAAAVGATDDGLAGTFSSIVLYIALLSVMYGGAYHLLRRL